MHTRIQMLSCEKEDKKQNNNPLFFVVNWEGRKKIKLLLSFYGKSIFTPVFFRLKVIDWLIVVLCSEADTSYFSDKNRSS